MRSADLPWFEAYCGAPIDSRGEKIMRGLIRDVKLEDLDALPREELNRKM